MKTLRVIVFLAMVIGLCWSIWTGYQQCEADVGSVYVRGLFWFECVTKKP